MILVARDHNYYKELVPYLIKGIGFMMYFYSPIGMSTTTTSLEEEIHIPISSTLSLEKEMDSPIDTCGS
jgi:hypothetical protein